MVMHILKFIGLLCVMYALTSIPYGMHINALITIYGLWKVVD